VAPMEFRVLGPLEIAEGDRPRTLGGPRQRTVLAHLILRANQAMDPDRLIDEVWGDEPPPAVRSTLRGYISHLRKALGPGLIERSSGGYVLRTERSAIDAVKFEGLVREGRAILSADPAAAAQAFEQALGLWRGPALGDLADQASLLPEIARLEELRLAALEDRIGAELELGRHRELVPELETLVAAHPFRERLWLHLVTALYRSGRQGDALAAFQRVRGLLAEELGIDPSPQLRRLQDRILRQDPSLEIAGEPLRGYRLLEQVGAGSFGSVHRAFQPQVGREVAIKTIHSRFANDPEFIRRFEAEAQLVARLEHPHVVPLYDFWRDPDGAYLVMRYLRGGSLRERLAQGPLGRKEAARLLDQVASALLAAHRQGVVHRDVKPANILFDEEDNAYLSDFGIAKDVEVAEVAPGGTPSPLAYYLSPEEARGEPATPRADIYNLGLVLYEILAGRHPFADAPPEEVLAKHLSAPVPSIGALRPDLPPGVDEVIAVATAKVPGDRFPDAQVMASTFRAALVPADGRRPETPSTEVRNPYKGLRPFLEPDAADFFGREAVVAELVARLSEQGDRSRFLAVVGPSGSGKSSLVLAGLLPALRAGAVAGSDRWFMLEMRPGIHPFEELASALMRIAVDDPTDLVELLERDDLGLVSAVEKVLPSGSELLLVIDQFEEVFTLVDDEDVRARFLGVVLAAATAPTSRVRVVCTLRADFYDRPLAYSGLAELVKSRTATVTPLVPEEIQRAVVGPAEGVGVRIDPALVADIVANVAAQPGALPLLQYALTELFEHRARSTLTLEGYRHIGGVSGALSRRAETLYRRLTGSGREAARQLFLRLITVGNEGGDDTRRRVLRSELASLEVDLEAMDAVIDTFGARRLLSFDRDPATRGPTVEVAHEALLTEWGRLRGWIETARENVRMHRRLVAGAREWTDSGRDLSFVLRGTHLARFEAWAESSGLALTADERAYLEAGLAQRDTDRAEEESRNAREAALERRSLTRLRALVGGLTALALVAGVLTTFAFSQRRAARREARLAEARELASAAVANLGVDPERSILLALEAVDTTWELDGTVVPEAEEALHRALRSSRVVYSVPHGGHGLSVCEGGALFATGGSHEGDTTATLWDLETGRRLMNLSGPHGGSVDVAVSSDARLVATTHDDGTVRVWVPATGEEIHVLRGHDGPVISVTFSRDGRWLATGGEDATVRVWDMATGAEKVTLTGHEGEIISTAFTPDGSRLASAGGDNTARVWDLPSGEAVVTLGGHQWGVTGVDFSADGTRVATSSIDARIRIWNARSGALLRTFVTPASLTTIDYSPDGTRIATAGTDAIGRILDARTGHELLTLAGHTGAGVADVAFTPDGDGLLTSGLDGTTRLWDVSVGGGRDWLTVPGAELIYTGVTFSPDGTAFAAPAEPSGVTVWDTSTGEELVTLTGYDAKQTMVAFSPDGGRIAAGSDLTRTPPVWDVGTGEVAFTLQGHQDNVRAVAFSPDGGRLVTGSWDGTARVWDASTGDERGVLRVGRPVLATAFSPEGDLIVTGDVEGRATVWDAATLEKVRSLDGHTSAIIGLAFGPGGTLATASEDGTAKVWAFESGEARVTFRGHGAAVNQVTFSADGTRIATSSEDRTVKIWDARTGEERLALHGPYHPVYGVDFSPDGRLLATASSDGTVSLYLLPLEELRDLARERVTRDLTDEECRAYLRLSACPA
jgi:WD40 repeat protein/serine/threonine protein kinase